jgi:hypothetical protein
MVDDRSKICHHLLHLTDLLQLSGYVLFCGCCQLPSEMGCWTMLVPLNPFIDATPLLNLPVAGLSGFAIFVAVSGIFLSFFLLLVPVIYEKYDKFAQLARTLKEVRVSFILTGAGTLFFLLIASVFSSLIFLQTVLRPISSQGSSRLYLHLRSLGVKMRARTLTRNPKAQGS